MIVVQNVSKWFDNSCVADMINLNICYGESVVIIGKSGCGKSIFGKMLMGIVKPDSGSIYINGLAIHDELNENLLQAINQINIAMLFQQLALFDSMTVYENIELALNYRFTDSSRNEINDKLITTLNSFGLMECASLYPGELSGGLCQRVAIARMLACDPKILIYDEPTTGLDPDMVYSVIKLMEDVHGSNNNTKISIIITHDVRCASSQLAKRVLWHDEGKLKDISSSDFFFHAPELKKTGVK